MKPLTVMLSASAAQEYSRLAHPNASKLERTILAAVDHKCAALPEHPRLGDHVDKCLIRNAQYGVTNLFRLKLPDAWRMVYTLTNSPDKSSIVAVILDIYDHPSYIKKFNYRKR